ncbi:MAG: tape measure protein [Clostridia bacterium]|nr:tape measure protein [Clostridia bacterium]
MTELGKAYVQVVPSAKGISKSLTGIIAPEAQDAGKKAGNNFVQNFSAVAKKVSSKASKIGNSLNSAITKPALAATSAIVGITLVKGFDRLKGIDTAKAKLYALGHSATSVKNIMSDALYSVKGTSFGLEEAAITASSAVAAGIKPGKELKKYLSLVGDAASITGTQMSEMGMIFNKVSTANKVSALELNQMMERGVPIIQLLAKSMEVSESKVRALASSGKISAQDFLNAVESGMGGAAKSIGELSVSAAFENLKAALSRVGAAFLGAGEDGNGFFQQLKPLIGDLTKDLDGITKTAEEWGKKFGETFIKVVEGIKQVLEWWKKLGPTAKKTIAILGGILVSAGPILIGVSKVITAVTTIIGIASKVFSVLKFVAGVIKLIGIAISVVTGLSLGWIAAIAAVVAAIVGIGVLLWKFRDNIKEFFISIGAQIKDFFTGIPEKLSALKDIIFNWFKGVKDMVIQKIKGFISSTFAFFQALPANMKQLLNDALLAVKSWGTNLYHAGVNSIKSLISGVLSFAKSIPSKVSSIGKSIVDGVWRGIVGAKDKFFNDIKSFFKGMVKSAKDSLKIHSPSKVMADQIGRWIPPGISEGISKNSRVIDTQMAKIAKGIGSAVIPTPQIEAFDYDEAMIKGQFFDIRKKVGAQLSLMLDNKDFSSAQPVRQTINIYQPVKTPGETARVLRQEAVKFGLAGE